MKTILISILQGVEAKNILRTNVYKNLVKEKVRVILLVNSKERIEYYKKDFDGPNIEYALVDGWKQSKLDKFFGFLKNYTLKTSTTNLRRRMVREDKGKWLNFIGSHVLNLLLSRKVIRKFVRYLDFRLIDKSGFEYLFNKYNPDLVFLAHLFEDTEVNVLREAKKRKIASVGFINTWDKLTARNPLRLLPDKLVVFNEIVKKEAVKYADMEPKDIVITGVPQYDIYRERRPLDRESFFAKKNLDNNKKLLVYAPMGKKFSNEDWDIINFLHGAIQSEQIKQAQLLVRFQPNDFFDEEEFGSRPWLVYDRPGVRFSKERGVDWDMSFADIEHLQDTLSNLDVLICYASSMGVDAAIFNKPVVNINFEISKKKLISKSPTYYYHMAHYKKALATGGIRVVDSKEDLVEWVNKYLARPDMDNARRERLVFEQAWKTDGKAGQRIAQTLLKEMGL